MNTILKIGQIKCPFGHFKVHHKHNGMNRLQPFGHLDIFRGKFSMFPISLYLRFESLKDVAFEMSKCPNSG